MQAGRWLLLVSLSLVGSVHAFTVQASSNVRPLFAEATSSASPSEPQRPKIAVVGSGAVGAYYGARLWETEKYDVQFFMRGEHLRVSQSHGLNVTSLAGDVFISPDRLRAANDTADMDPADWIIVALKSTALSAIPELIAPLLKPNVTRVLVIMNGLIEDDLVRMLQRHVGEDDDDDGTIRCCRAIYGGMALVCSNRLGPGHVDHSYGGFLSAGVAVSSTSSDDNDDEEHKLAFEQLWEHTKIDVAYEPCLLAGRWRKNVWNLPFNGISVAMGGITVDRIVDDPGLRHLADTIMDETIAAANADLARIGRSDSHFLGDGDKEKMFALSDAMGPYRTSTMIDLVDRNPMEVTYLFRKPVERAKELGVDVPHLETVVLQIEALQRHHGLF